jgi:methylated-DNA-[protein]-cysteine S-methyltransferase
MSLYYQTMESPVGPLYLVADEQSLHGVVFKSMWPGLKKRFKTLTAGETPVMREARKQLNQYFEKKRSAFDLPMVLHGTEFQKKAWSALARIPFGQTRSYKQQAAAMRAPKAVRAVGRSNGQNPFCILLPCHRVVGSDGALTGFGGGLPAKRFLLALERSPRRPGLPAGQSGS